MASRLMPWAVVTIRLCAAWRNTSGQPHHRHRAGGDDVGENLARPHRGQLVDIAHDQQRCPVGDRRQQRPHQQHDVSTIDVSSTTSRPQSSGLSPSRLNPPVLWDRPRVDGGSSSPRTRWPRSSAGRRARSARTAGYRRPWQTGCAGSRLRRTVKKPS